MCVQCVYIHVHVELHIFYIGINTLPKQPSFFHMVFSVICSNANRVDENKFAGKNN